MSTSLTPDHQGTLVAELKGEVTITVKGVSKELAEQHLTNLVNRRSIRIENLDGTMYVIDAMSLIAARWEPNT